MSTPASRARMLKEASMLETQPPPQCTAWRIHEQINHWHAQIRGPADTPYEGGHFKLELRVPDRYPFEPPRVQFLTPIYHPNVDREGRICLDTLNMPPKGSWSPGSNLCTVLASIQQLMAYPNANDGLVAEITQHFKDNRASFDLQAREMTRRHAVANVTADPEAAASASTAASAAASNSAAAAAATQAVTATPAASVAATASVPAATASVADGSNAAADTNRALAPSPSADSSNLAPHAAIGSKRAASPNAGEDAPSDAKKQRTEQIPDTTDAAATSTSTSSPAQSVEQQS